MAKQTKAPRKRTATKRVRKTGNQSRRATVAAPPQRSTQKRRTRGTGDTPRKTAPRPHTAPLSLARENPLALTRTSAAAARLYTQRARAALSAAWEGVTANVVARGRRLLSQIKNVSLHMTQSSAQKKRLA